MGELVVKVNDLIDLMECIQDSTTNKTVIDTVNEVIDIVYEISDQMEV